MSIIEKALYSLLGALLPGFINRFENLERWQKTAMLDLSKLKESQEKLAKTVVDGFVEVNSDLKRLSDKIAAGESVTQADIDDMTAKNDTIIEVVKTAVKDVDTAADTAVGSDDDAPAQETPAAPAEVPQV